ncbi:MAG: S1C family serine protease [Haloarculaceae archaeon]
MRSRIGVGLLVGVLVFGLVVGAFGAAQFPNGLSLDNGVTAAPGGGGGGGGGHDLAAAPPGARTVNLTATGGSYRQVFERTHRSIVTIQVTTTSGAISQGSGFVYDSVGHVVTNEHVVRDAQNVTVQFADGTWHRARIVGTDTYTDLSVLKVSNVPDDARPLALAAQNPVPGQRVAALGSPFGLEGSITSGIVSGVNRSMTTNEGFAIPATIQTDAPINPGNSGGPLVSLNGTVVGVNRAKEGDNVGFAISPLLVDRVVPELIAHGSFQHPYVGIRSIPVTPAVADAYDLDRAQGVVVVDVLDGGPADGALQAATSARMVDGRRVPTGGDVVLAIDGTPIRTQQELSRYLMLHTRPGDRISVTVLRDGERVTTHLTLGTRPSP